MSILKVVRRRLSEDWLALLCVFIGMLFAIIFTASALIYLGTLKQMSLKTALGKLSSDTVDIGVFGSPIPLTKIHVDNV